MRIFDSRWFGSHGIGRFASELSARLTGYEAIKLRGPPSSPLDPWVLRRHLREETPSFFFSPGYNAPLESPCPFAFCVHDLNHLFVRENSTALKRAYYRHLIRPAISRAQVVLTVSSFSRDAICEWAGVKGDRVKVVGNGVSSAFTPGGVAKRFDRPHFLYVGNQKPHKNLQRLLLAFAQARLSDEFVIVSTGAVSPSLRALIRKLGLTDHIYFVGEVSDEALAALYRGAQALVLVSVYEGFGLPVAEAMSCGTPVLSSKIPPIEEITAGSARLVDPLDIEEISVALRQFASDGELSRTLRERGIARARSFSWEVTVNKVHEALHGCA